MNCIVDDEVYIVFYCVKTANEKVQWVYISTLTPRNGILHSIAAIKATIQKKNKKKRTKYATETTTIIIITIHCCGNNNGRTNNGRTKAKKKKKKNNLRIYYKQNSMKAYSIFTTLLSCSYRCFLVLFLYLTRAQ